MKSYEEAYQELEQDQDALKFCNSIRAAEKAISNAWYMRHDEVTNKALALSIRALQEEDGWEDDLPVTAETIVDRQDWIVEYLTKDPDEILDAVFGSFYLLSYGDVTTTAHSYIVDNAADIAATYHQIFGD